MNEKLREKLRKEMSSTIPFFGSDSDTWYKMERFDDSIRALDDLIYWIDRSRDSISEEKLETLLTGNNEERDAALNGWARIEPIMKEIYKAAEGKDCPKDMKLEDLYKDYYKVAPTKLQNDPEKNFSLSWMNMEFKLNDRRLRYYKRDCYPQYPYLYSFFVTYSWRNIASHEPFKDLPLSDQSALINATFVCILYLCYQNREKLSKLANLKRFESELSMDWAAVNIAEKKKRNEKFGYVDFLWDDEYSTKDLIELSKTGLEKNYQIKLFGIAGLGKTTALNNIKYYITDKFDQMHIYPVFYELINLNQPKNDYLLSIVQDTFRVSEQAARGLLNTDNVIFLLDGYNEIADYNIKKSLANQIDSFIEYHPKFRIVFTDRTRENDIPILAGTCHPLSHNKLIKEDIVTFFNNNCKEDKQALDILLSITKSENNKEREVFEKLTTPLKLKCITDYVKENKKLPDNFLDEYISKLMDRERYEKKSRVLQVLNDYLSIFAGYMEDKELEYADQHKFCKLCSSVNRLYSYDGYNSIEALELAEGMGLLFSFVINEDKQKMYKFDDVQIKEYYTDKYWDNEELIELITGE